MRTGDLFSQNESRARGRGSKLNTAENWAMALSACLEDLGNLSVDEEVDVRSRCESRFQIGSSCANTSPVRDRKWRPTWREAVSSSGAGPKSETVTNSNRVARIHVMVERELGREYTGGLHDAVIE